MKHLVTFFFLLFAYLFLSPFSIHAQTNTYSCVWSGTACGLNPASVDCFPDFIPWTDCVGQPDAPSCLRVFPCRLVLGTPVPPPPPANSPLCPSGNSIKTPFGCLPFTGSNGPARSMIQILLTWSIGLAAGVSLLTLIYASFQIATAAGDAKRVQAGRELVTASIGGLVLIAMGIVILNFLGVRLLGLGSFGFNI